MRAAAVFGLGTSLADLRPFQAVSEMGRTDWVEGLPGSPEETDAILLFGGDGTIHRHLAALVRLQLPVLIVPSGSGNDFARALDLRSPADSLRAWRDFLSHRIGPSAIDLGVITPVDSSEKHYYFCCVAGCGLDAAVARMANQMPRWLRAHGGYAIGAIPTILRFSAFRLRITTVPEGSGQSSETLAVMVAFANTPFYGHGMRIAPRAKMSDGRLDVCLIRNLSKLKLLSFFPTVYFGRHVKMHEVEYSMAERVRVETESPREIYADGEYVCNTPVEIRAVADALKIIAPGGERAA